MVSTENPIKGTVNYVNNKVIRQNDVLVFGLLLQLANGHLNWLRGNHNKPIGHLLHLIGLRFSGTPPRAHFAAQSSGSNPVSGVNFPFVTEIHHKSVTNHPRSSSNNIAAVSKSTPISSPFKSPNISTIRSSPLHSPSSHSKNNSPILPHSDSQNTRNLSKITSPTKDGPSLTQSSPTSIVPLCASLSSHETESGVACSSTDASSHAELLMPTASDNKGMSGWAKEITDFDSLFVDLSMVETELFVGAPGVHNSWANSPSDGLGEFLIVG
ncbi:hypothetical protein LWI29_030565 [Acer saccharum]|uniref:Uncharacterized protein n=1 Tax=Acer saccharum TaxID=4024 RepID=A0AA39W408_ACESA|nr:hypothetical protein LWI29_030565 [Acer saccharum]